MKAFARLFVIPVFLALFLVGCDTNVTDDEPATVSFELQPVFDGQPFSTASTYSLNGSAITFSAARLYISQFTLIHEDGTETTFAGDAVTVTAKGDDGADIAHTVSDRVMLAKHDAGVDSWSLGDAPAGRYTGIRFQVGITGTDNKVDPTQFPAGHDMAKQTDKNNHWSWNSGYIYVRMDGLVDTDGDSTPDTPWETHLGMNSFAREVTLSADFTLEGGKMSNVHAMVDYADILSQIDLGLESDRLCHTMDNMPVANKVAGQLSSAFMFHGLHSMDQ